MKWITRSHIHVDRVACPWLILRFVDSDAEFVFVPTSRIPAFVEREGAIAFDAPGVELGHHDGKCSFETIIEKYGLTDKALLRLACWSIGLAVRCRVITGHAMGRNQAAAT